MRQGIRDRFNISRLAIAFPRITILFWLVVSVAGGFAFSKLKFELLPDITFPLVIATASAEGLNSEETAVRLSLPMEQRLKALEGLNEMRTTITAGRATVTLLFQGGLKERECVRAVEAVLDGMEHPANSERRIFPLNVNQSSAVTYAVTPVSGSLEELADLLVAKASPRLQEVPGVHEVRLLGRLPKEGEEIREAPTVVRWNGTDALALDILKNPEANTMEVVEAVSKEAGALARELPEARFELAKTQAVYIRDATHATVEALLIAVALSVLVIYPFLRSWTATLISALAIPTSLLGTAIVMALCGFELDTITLLALALVVGIIIDDAIVDIENIARHLEMGKESPKIAALAATQEIGLTVTAATLTIVAVFLPVALMEGVVGRFFKPFGVTVSAAVLISLLVARTLSPMLAVAWLKPRAAGSRAKTRAKMETTYRRILCWALKRPVSVAGLAVGSLAVGIALIPLIPRGLVPRLDRREFKIAVSIDPVAGADHSTVFRENMVAVRHLERFLRSLSEVENVFAVIGSRDGNPGKSIFYVTLAEIPAKRMFQTQVEGRPRRLGVRARRMHTAEFEDYIRRRLPVRKGVTCSVEGIPFVELDDQKPINAALLGPDRAVLRWKAAELADRLGTIQGFVDITAPRAGQESEPPFHRLNASDAEFITANLTEQISLGEATQKLVAAAKEILPAGVTLKLGGDSDNFVKVFKAFGGTLGFSVLCILGVLLALFRNWKDPLVILLSLPLSVVGAVIGLLIARADFGMISLIGVVFLFGLVNKNAILLVDCINQLRHAGMGATASILRAGSARLRPILMTTLATILGMLPVAIGMGVGSELRAPMAIAIIGGLLTSTILSLVVVPVLYSVLRGKG